MKLNPILAATLALGLLGTPALAHDATKGDITVDHPWARPNLPNRPAAAYFAITNNGDTAERITAATSTVFGAIEIHTVKKEGEVMKMQPVEAIEIAPGETTMLEPGGFHLMLFDAAQVFEEGESFPITLVLENAGEIELEVKVEKRTGHEGGHDDGSGHSN